jgi:hypothetical protein
MNRLALVLLTVLLAACGTQAGSTDLQRGPYSQDATAECLEQAGYDFEIGHGDPPSMRAEDIVFMIWLENVADIEFFHPSAEVTTEGERHDNAVVVWDEDVSSADRETIVGCLR